MAKTEVSQERAPASLLCPQLSAPPPCTGVEERVLSSLTHPRANSGEEGIPASLPKHHLLSGFACACLLGDGERRGEREEGGKFSNFWAIFPLFVGKCPAVICTDWETAWQKPQPGPFGEKKCNDSASGREPVRLPISEEGRGGGAGGPKGREQGA